MYCGKCGKEIPEGQTICEDCTNKIKTDNGKRKLIIKKPVKIVLIIILAIILLSVIITIINISNSTLKKDTDLKEDIETNNSIENKDESIIIFDDNTSTGATFNIKREDIDKAIKSAYQGSQCEKLIGEFCSNNSEWTKVDDGISNYAMYFYIPAINQKSREMGLYAFRIGIYVTPNNYIQSITLHSAGRTGVITDYTVSEIIKNNSIYEEFYYDILKKLFNDDNIIQNMNKVENANKVNGIGTGGIIIKDNITYFYLIQLSEEKNMYSKQYSIGAVGNEKAKEMKDAYKGYNIYIDVDDNKTNSSNNIEPVEEELNTTSSTSSNSNNTTSSNNNSNTNTNSKPVKETIEMPYFQMGYELKEYTDDLDKLGIKYKIVKKSNLDYEDNTVISVEHNGENIEKGTTITITVADNVYDLNVRFDTYYLLELADISATDYENKTINVKVDVKGKNVFNGNLPLTYVDWADTAFTIKGKPDIRNDFEITVEGKKITKSIKTYYFHMYEHEIWVCKEFRIGS